MSSSAGPRLLGPAEVRSLAASLDLRPTKQRGQNFVIDPNTVRRITAASGITGSDVVIEVGPGLGSLTLALLEVASRVVAIEVDDRLAGLLPETIERFAPDQAGRFELVHADALRVTAIPGPPPTALVANLPYNVSVPVLLHLLALLPSLERGLVMVQSEVADRLAARPGSKVYGVPSVKAAWYAEVRRAGAIGRNVFWPAPNVDSGLVAWTRRDPPTTTVSREQVFAVVDAAFGQRRKVLRGVLKGIAGSAAAAEAALTAAGVDPLARGESLELADFVRITEELHMTVRARAAAKINLHLGVGGARADGFHELHTVYQAVSLFDEVTAAAADGWTVETTTADYVDADALPAVADNIVSRAAALLADLHGIPAHARLRVDKAIPVAGGLAGGSADAAAALVVLDRLWDLRTTHEDLYRLAAELGSDVPFGLLGGTGLGTGRGEVVEALDDPGHWWWVVVPNRRGMATPEVYRHFDELNPDAGPPAPAPDLVRALTSRDPRALGPTLRNDLQEPAFDLRPDLRDAGRPRRGRGGRARAPVRLRADLPVPVRGRRPRRGGGRRAARRGERDRARGHRSRRPAPPW